MAQEALRIRSAGLFFCLEENCSRSLINRHCSRSFFLLKDTPCRAFCRSVDREKALTGEIDGRTVHIGTFLPLFLFSFFSLMSVSKIPDGLNSFQHRGMTVVEKDMQRMRGQVAEVGYAELF